MCFSPLPDYGSSLQHSCQKPGLQFLLWGKEQWHTLALIRHLRVIRLNTAFTLHSAHSSCAALAQEMHCMHTHAVKHSVRLCLILQAPFKSCVRVWRQTSAITLNVFLIAELQTSCLSEVVAWGKGRAWDPIESQRMKRNETISHATVDFGQGETGALTHTIDERINH